MLPECRARWAAISARRPLRWSIRLADDQWNVLELSSFQLETIEQFRAKIAVALNVTPDHLDRHHTLRELCGRQGAPVRNAGPRPASPCSTPTMRVCRLCRAHSAGSRGGSAARGAFDRGAWLADGYGDARRRAVNSAATTSRCAGIHNVENTMAAAISLSSRRRRTSMAIAERYSHVSRSGAPARVCPRDATACDTTTIRRPPMSTHTERPSMLSRVVCGSFSAAKTRTAITASCGRSFEAKARRRSSDRSRRRKIAAQLNGVAAGCMPAPWTGPWRRRRARPLRRDIVLLAPACASFDQFENFEHRGRVFKEAVRALVVAQQLKTDRILFYTIVVMVCFGLVMVFSASSVMAEFKYRLDVLLRRCVSLAGPRCRSSS